MTEDGKEDLELVATDELMDELFSRFDHAVFSGVKTGTADGEVAECRWNGHSVTCAGLCADLQLEILREYNRPKRKGRKGK